MTVMFWSVVLAASLAVVPQPKPPAAPYVPLDCAAMERSVLSQAASALASGNFTLAQNALRPFMPDPITKVYVDWTPLARDQRAPFGKAFDIAIDRWNKDLQGLIEFKLTGNEEEADLVILFERRLVVPAQNLGTPCLDVQVGGVPRATKRFGRLYVALMRPIEPSMHTVDEFSALMRRGLAMYLGFVPQPKPDAVVQQHAHVTQDLALDPTPQQVQVVRDLQQARLKMMEYATKETKVYLPKPVISVDKLSADAGNLSTGDIVHLEYKISNKGDAPLEIYAKPSCGCTVVEYDRVIAPGKTTTLVTELRTAGFRGPLSKAITITSNDPDKPVLGLTVNANIKGVVTFEKDGPVNLNLKPNTTATHEMKIKLEDKEPVEVRSVTCTVAFAKARFEKLATNGSTSEYKIILDVGPEAPIGRSSFMLMIGTTSKAEPQVAVQVLCEKGISIMPPSLFFGAIRSDAKLPIVQYVTLQRAGGGFKITSIEKDDDKLDIKQETLPGGDGYRLAVSYNGGWNPGGVTRTIIIKTDDPAQPEFRVIVAAQVLQEP